MAYYHFSHSTRGWGGPSATKLAVGAAVFVVRVLLGGLLLAAGGLKVGHSAELAASIAGFRLLPAAIVGPLAVALPYIELLLGAYLVAGLFTRAVAALCALQFVSTAVRSRLPSCDTFPPTADASGQTIRRSPIGRTLPSI